MSERKDPFLGIARNIGITIHGSEAAWLEHLDEQERLKLDNEEFAAKEERKAYRRRVAMELSVLWFSAMIVILTTVLTVWVTIAAYKSIF